MERKLQSMEKVLPESLFKLPLHFPEAELGEVLADCRLLANEHGRAQINADPRGGETWERSTPSPMEEDEPAPSLTLLRQQARPSFITSITTVSQQSQHGRRSSCSCWRASVACRILLRSSECSVLN